MPAAFTAEPQALLLRHSPVNNRNKTAGYSGKGIAPVENHLILLEDEPSYCQRTGKV